MGPAGADGAQGPQGIQGEPGDDGEDADVSDLINNAINDGVLADIHHVVLTQKSGGDKAKATFGGVDFAIDKGDDWDNTLNVGEKLTIVAKAGSEDGKPIAGVTFLWDTNDNTVLAVTDDGANTGTIEAVSSGSAKVIVKLEGRGIDIEFDIMSLSEVKLVEIDSPASGHFMLVGESVDLKATAYDSESDKDADNIVATDLLEFRSSAPAIVKIVGMKAKAVGVGEAEITAHVGSVPSEAITINVSPSGDVTHKLTFTRVAASALKITRTQTAGADTPDDDTDDTFTYAGGNAATPDGSLTFTVQIRRINADDTTPVDTAITVADGLSVRVQGDEDAIATLPTTPTGITIATGQASIVIAADGWGTPGMVRLIVSYDSGANYAEDVVLPLITVEDAATD